MQRQGSFEITHAGKQVRCTWEIVGGMIDVAAGNYGMTSTQLSSLTVAANIADHMARGVVNDWERRHNR